MELRQLKYFLTVAEEKSFVKASKKSFVSQQALSKAIQNLEKELHGTLFTRNNTGVELTPRGISLRERAIQITELVDQTYTDLNVADHAEKKMIFLGVPYSILDLFKLDMFFAFSETNRNVEIHVSEVPDKIVETDIYYNYLDIGIVGGRSDFTNFNAHQLLRNHTMVAMHKDHPLSSSETINLKDLRNEVFITPTKDYNAYDMLLKACAGAGFTPKIGQQSGNIDLIRQLVCMNQGIYLCPDNRKPFLDNPEIIVRSIEEDPPVYEIFLLTNKTRSLSKTVSAFRDYILSITVGDDPSAWGSPS